MDGKMHRYMQRIEKIINTPSKVNNNVSPLRPTKSPLKHRPNHLDRYIKYELSMKIINSIASRHNSQLVMLFFNMLRNTDYRQKEKIYKFVAIQRQEARVDLGIAAKLMIAVLKQLLKKRVAHFISSLQNDRPLEFAFRKLLKEETSHSGELIRANSQNNPNNKISSGWFEDMETQNQKASMLKKINLFKTHTAKVMARYVSQCCNKAVRIGFEAVKLHVVISNAIRAQQFSNRSFQNQIKTWEQKQKNYLSEIQQLSEKLSKCQILLLKQSSYKVSESAKKVQVEPVAKNVKLDNCYNNVFCFVSRKIDQDKFKLLQHISIILHEAASAKRRNKAMARNEYFLRGALKVYQLFSKTCKTAMDKLKQTTLKIQTQAIRNVQPKPPNLIFLLLQLSSRRKLQYSLLFFKQLQLHKISKTQRPAKQDLLTLNYDIEQRSNSSHHIDNKSNRKISMFSNSETLTPTAKPNFHLFVDRIFKLILVISKLLVPMKQGFDRINQYALYSYEIEDKLKSVALKHLRESFAKIAQYSNSEQPKQSVLTSKLLVLQGVVRERLVESFSRMKIISRENELKIKLFPVKLHIVEMTKQFIEERKMYSQYSLDNWAKLRENLLEDVRAGPEKDRKNPFV